MQNPSRSKFVPFDARRSHLNDIGIELFSDLIRRTEVLVVLDPIEYADVFDRVEDDSNLFVENFSNLSS